MTIEMEPGPAKRSASLFSTLRSRAAGAWAERMRRRADAARTQQHPGGLPWRVDGELARISLGGRPLAFAGVAAGAGLLVGATIAVQGILSRRSLDSCEEIIARALCHEDPDMQTHRGPLWAGYRKDARRVLAALREAGLLIEPS